MFRRSIRYLGLRATVVAAALLVSPASTFATTAPIALFPAEGTPADTSGNHHDAVLPNLGVGVAQYATGQVGQAFHFDGVDTYANFNYGSGTDWFQYQSFTMGMWVKDNSTVGSPQPDGTVLADHHSNFDPLWTISYSAAGSAYSYQSGDLAAPLAFPLTVGSWHYLAITRDGTSRVTTVYVDGSVVAYGTGSGSLDYSFAAGMRFGASFSATQHWTGDLDEMRFYDRALGAVEVVALGVPAVLPPITSTSFIGPTAGNPNAYFTATTQAGVAVRVQSSTTPDTESSWIDLPDGNGGQLTEDALNPGSYKFFNGSGVDIGTAACPRVAGIYFRFVSSLSGYADGKSDNHAMGPYDLGLTVLFTATGPASTGAVMSFTATTVSGWTVRVQSTTDTTTEASWTDVPGGTMTEDPNTPGSFTLASTAYGQGAAISFRAVVSKAGQTDMKSLPAGPFLLHQAVLSIAAALSSTTDWTNGATAYVGDYLIYKLTFKNSGDATAKSLRVSATVPTFTHNDQPITVKTVAGSTAVTLTVGDTSGLDVGGYFSGSNSLISGTTQIASITDLTHLVLSAPATLGGTGATTVVFSAAGGQFALTDLSFNAGGTYVPESAPGARNAHIDWDVGDLPGVAGFVYSQNVIFVVHLTSKVRADQTVGITNDYTVFSTITPPQPGIGTTGFLSHSPNVGCVISGPISFTMVPQSTMVAPGGYMTYVFTLTNRSSATVTNPVAVVAVPDNTRFSTSYASGAKGITFLGTGTLTYKQVYVTGLTLPQIVITFPALSAHGVDKIYVTFQAKWADPSEVAKINTTDYGAAFLDPLSPKPVSMVAQFAALLKAAGTTPGPTDFFKLISDPANKLARSLDQSGVVNVALSGGLDGEPLLYLLKAISNKPDNTDEDGNGGLIDTAKPGDKVTFVLAVTNGGTSAADEVYVGDLMPDHTTYVVKSEVMIGTTKSSTLSKPSFSVVPDPDGHHLRFVGLHLEPQDSVSLTYSVLVDSGINAPAADQLLAVGDCAVGSGSTDETPPGILGSSAIKIVGAALFPKPLVVVMNPNPLASSDVTATAGVLNTLYKKTPSTVPLTDPKNKLSYIPGVQRYYIHYENTGTTAAVGMKLNFPIPAHTTFYRASWVTLTPNTSPGSYGDMPGTLIKPAGGSIVPPAIPTTGIVAFALQTLAATAKGDVMVEVIVNPDAVQATGSIIGAQGTQEVAIFDSTVVTPASLARDAGPSAHILSFFGSHQAHATLAVVPVADHLNVPKVGIQKIVSSQNVLPGEQFTVILTVCNWGDVGCNPFVDFNIPANAKFISADAGQSIVNPTADNPNLIEALLASNNGPIPSVGNSWLLPHTAASVTITLQATGAAGTDIVDNTSLFRTDFLGAVNAIPSVTHIYAPNPILPVTLAPFIGVRGISFTTLKNGPVLIDLGGGNIVAAGGGNIVSAGGGNIISAGGGNIVSAGGGNIVSAGGGNIVAAGGGNVIAVQLPGASGFTSIGGLLANQSAAVVTPKLGNLVVQNTTALVAAGGGNIVAAGGGNLVAAGGGNIVSAGGGNIVSAGGGNIVSAGGGNLVAAGGGNIVAAGGGNIVSAGGGNIIASSPAATLTINHAGGQIVAAGGGN